MNDDYMTRRQALWTGTLVAASSGMAGAYAARNTPSITRVSPTVAASTGMEGDVFAEYEADDGVPSSFVITMDSIDLSWSEMPARIDGVHIELHVDGPDGQYLVCWADPDVYALGDAERGMAEDDAITDYPGAGTMEGSLFGDGHDPADYAVDEPGESRTFDVDFVFRANFYFRDDDVDPFEWETSFASQLRVIHAGEAENDPDDDGEENEANDDGEDEETEPEAVDPAVSADVSISRA